MLATWRVGAAFLPCDPSWPEERARACLEESRAHVVVHEGLALELLESGPAGAPSDDLAYVIYTSGSTGRPKGVRVSHRGLVPMLRAQIRAFGLGPGKRALLYLSTAFDASISDIGTSLLSGATLVIPPTLPPPRQLCAYLGALGITHADLPPSLLSSIDSSEVPSCLETVIIGGEVCPPRVVREWATRVRVVNVYGPTEATICTSLCECDRDAWETPLLGAPLPHVEYRVEDGELWIGGSALALGYIARPELDAERFVTKDGRRYYRTGDVVRGTQVDRLEFVGRRDRQVKLQGRLVCPEEVEAAVLRAPSVRETAVVVERRGTRSVLTAYVVPREGATLLPDSLREDVSRALPPWMVPRFVAVSSLARLETGKVDRAALVETGGRARVIADAFAEVLGGVVGEESDFLALGGDSLAAFEVSSLAELSGAVVPPDVILAARTPRAIAESARETRERGRAVSLLDRIASSHLAPSVPPSGPRSAGDEWLVTGARGFLGSRLVEGLLARTESTIHCLVRGPRGSSRSPRVRLHYGDVSLPCFGLPPEVWSDLTARVGHVIHAAAIVNLALPFDVLAGTNIGGASNVADFVEEGPVKALTHLSTLAVLASSDLSDPVLHEGSRLSGDTTLFGAYAQTKYVAEAIVRRRVPHALVLRPGLLTGDSGTGAHAPACTLAAFLRGIKAIGCIPEGDFSSYRVDITPVDHAVATILDLAIQHPRERSVVHISSRRGASLEALLAAMRERHRVDVVPREVFLARARERLPRKDVLALAGLSRRLLGGESLRDADLFLLTGRTFESGLAERLTGRSCPDADASLLGRYVDASEAP
jgi:amino acid adenylation domain-containing protein